MDIKEFTDVREKRCCPECGAAIVPNKRGRPRSFCSDRCRWTFDKRRERRRKKEGSRNEDSGTESAAGIGAEAGGV